MNQKLKFRIKSGIKEIFTAIIGIIIVLFQFVPCASIWFGIMSVPLIMYIGFLIADPNIIGVDFDIFIRRSLPWMIIVLISGLFSIFSLIYQLVHRKQLVKKGPYRIIRHPQYLGVIIMTFGLTMISLNTDPVFPSILQSFTDKSLLFWIWVIEVLAYIGLAKIEEFALKNKFGDDYISYINSVGFIIPIVRVNNKKRASSNIME